MQDTQQIILDAAIAVFNEDLSAPLERVAEKAGITRRTLHRLFKDRNELLELCEETMQKSCNEAMAGAWESSKDPLKQLERMLYAGIDCGAKYSFFHKLHNREGHKHNHRKRDCAAYDKMHKRFTGVVDDLRKSGKLHTGISTEWVYMLFSGVITATINGATIGGMPGAELKKFAWFSLSHGIGAGNQRRAD